MKFWKTILNKNKNLGKWREDYCTWRFAMIEEEKKIYKILHARFLRMLALVFIALSILMVYNVSKGISSENHWI